MHEFRNQPIKGLYLLYEFIVTAFIRLPFWALYNIPTSARPRQSWTWKRAVLVRSLDRFNVITHRTGQLTKSADHLTIAQGLDIKHVWVAPTPNLINAELKGRAEEVDVQPISVPGYWMDKKDRDTDIGAPSQPGEKVVYSLHGGGYIYFSASPKEFVANIARGLLEHCIRVDRIFSIEYRLAKAHPHKPTHAFPAALFDVLAGYVYLTNTVGFAPENIIVEGDSAGGGLALALTRYLVENAGMEGLPAAPSALVLLSPWVDLSRSDVRTGSSQFYNHRADYVGSPHSLAPDYPRYALHGPLGLDGALLRFVSPASTDQHMPKISYKGFPRTLVVAGEAEVLLTQIKVLVENMIQDMGQGDGEGQVTYHESPDSVHDHLLFTFHEPERTQTLEAIADWLEPGGELHLDKAGTSTHGVSIRYESIDYVMDKHSP
ncbi:alpha/beta-hydrolase [Artomyces pyxidatus]|uniref:Alpha/beta-hydrolase n=1 Tax=Artomyces pyxidatus TaxID=48021 RepID=A0ACB8SN62_9AGAM|nr:alpha/beta-hydrolase [Artomyces pyxidatus]